MLARWELVCFTLTAALVTAIFIIIITTVHLFIIYQRVSAKGCFIFQGTSGTSGDVFVAAAGWAETRGAATCTGQPPTERMIWFQVSVLLRLRNPDVNKWSSLVADVIWTSLLHADVLALLCFFSYAI